MRNDVAKLKLQKEAFEKNDARLVKECSDCRNILAAKRTTLSSAEASVKNADLKFTSVNVRSVIKFCKFIFLFIYFFIFLFFNSTC